MFLARIKSSTADRKHARSFGEQRSISDSDSSEYTDDSDYDSDEEDIVEVSPLPSIRPVEPAKAAGYDTIKATWLPRNRPADETAIREGLAKFWSVIKPIRDNWKEAQDKFKKAEDSKKGSAILSRPVERQRSLMEAAFQSAVTHGHPDILRQ